MAIKTAVGDIKTSDEKSFPKLMIGNVNWIIEVHRHPEFPSLFIAIHRHGPHAGSISTDFNISGFSDYNEPITLQNL